MPLWIYLPTMTWENTASIEIATTPQNAYETVRQLERMGEWSPENLGGRWIAGDGSAVGDQFEGDNAIGDRKWSAVAEVVRCDPGQAFCFTVGGLDEPVAEWEYLFAASETGTTVTENWKMTRLPPSLVDAPEDRIQARVDMVAAGMRTTLDNLKASLEA
jgi:hypothetical protein